MARIDLGNLGDSVLQPVREIRVNRPGINFDPVVNVLAQRFHDERTAAKQEFERAREIDFQGKSEVSAANAANEFDALNDGAQQRIAAGEDAKTVEDEFNLQASTLSAKYADQFQGEQRNRISPTFEKMRIAGQAKFRNMSAKIMADRTLDNLTATLEAVSVSALKDPDGAMTRADLAGESAIQNGADPGKVADAVKASKQRYRFDNLATQIESSSDIGHLSRVRADLLAGGKIKGLDNAQALVLANRAEARINQRKADIERSQRMAESMNNAQGRKFEALFESGLPVSPAIQAEAAKFIARTAGTEISKSVALTVEASKYVPAQNAMTLEDQGKYVQGLEESLKVATNADEGLRLASQYSVAAKAYQRNAADIQRNPLEYMVTRQGVDLPDLDLNDLADSLDERAEYAAAATGATGVQAPLLTDAEAKAVTLTLERMQPSDRVAVLGKLAKAPEGLQGAAMATIRKIGGEKSEYAQAATYANVQDATGRNVGEVMMLGADSLAKGPNGEPKNSIPTDFAEEFDDRTKGLFNNDPEGRSVALLGMSNAYMGYAAGRGKYDPKMLDDDSFDQAFAAYFGSEEVAKNKDGTAFLPPRGMDADEFRMAMGKQLEVALPQLGAEADRIPAIIKNVRYQGTRGGYFLIYNGVPLKDATGRTVVMPAPTITKRDPIRGTPVFE